MELKKIKKVYCIGIGGIGLSALANFFLQNGAEVSGSDQNIKTFVTELLQKNGVKKIFGEQKKKNLEEFFAKEILENNFQNCLVIYTIAIDKSSNEEFLKAKEIFLNCLSYPETLGEITRIYKNIISVCGTHGKTTTTAMAYFALKEAGINAGVIVGSFITDENDQQVNFIMGDGDYLIIESCEYRRSFLNLNPKYILITNIDSDHLDYFKDLNDIKNAFQEFTNKKGVEKVFSHELKNELENNLVEFNNINLSVLGQHNKDNAQLVLKLVRYLNLEEKKAREGLKKFKGTWRRMEFKDEIIFENKNLKIYDDYGHHPTEIRATLLAMREKYKNQNFILVFQPHLYSRTKIFLKEFSESFDLVNKVFILPIYAAREKIDESISSQILCERIGRKASYVQDFETARNKVLEYISKDNVHKEFILLTIGAGEAYRVGDIILNMQQSFEQYYKSFFEGKKITKQGFGILGRGAAVTKFLIKMGADILVTDIKERAYFELQIKEIFDYKNEINSKSKIDFIFGQHRLEDFTNCDFLIQASGVPKDNIYLQEARVAGKAVYQESSLFCKLLNSYFNNSNENKKKINIIGVTGTRGKTTTTFLIYEILKKNFENKNVRIHLGGNIQNVCTLGLLEKIRGGDYVVLELDSWILQGFKEINFSPNITVFTNLMNDHFNYYHHNLREYFFDKANIFLYQTENDLLILSESSQKACQEYLDKNNFENLKYNLISQTKIDEDKNNFESVLIGEHNRDLISLAIEAARGCGVGEEKIKESIKSFKGVAGRLEMRREIKGVKYYNDTTATTEDATIAGLEALRNKKIILICGGKDKELSSKKLAEKIIDFKNKNILEKIILLSDHETTNGTDKLIQEFEKRKFGDFIEVKNIKRALIVANQDLNKIDIILFSPAFASFGLFKNEYDRGDKFNEIVDNL